MPYHPEFNKFLELSQDADLVPVYRRLLSDDLTPVSAFRKLDFGGTSCLFESVVGGEKVGRYSFLASDPFLQFQALGSHITVTSDSGTEERDVVDPLEELRQQVRAIRTARLAELPPFTSGAVGYASYDAVRYVEHLPDPPSDDRGLPDLAFAFYDHMVVFVNLVTGNLPA